MEPAAFDEGCNVDAAADNRAAAAADATNAFVASASGSGGGIGAQPPLEASPSKQRDGDVRAVLVEGIDGRWFRGSSLWEFLPFRRRRASATATATGSDEWHPDATPKKRGNADGIAFGGAEDEVKRKREPPRFNWSLHKGIEEGEEDGMEVDANAGASAASATAGKEPPPKPPAAQLLLAAAAVDAPLPPPSTTTSTSFSSSSSSSSPLAAAGPATPPLGLILQKRPSLQAPLPPPPPPPTKDLAATPEAPRPSQPPPPSLPAGGDGERERARDELAYSSLRARWVAAAASEDFKTVPASVKAKELVPACRITTGARAAAEKKARAEAEAAAEAAARAKAAASSSEA